MPDATHDPLLQSWVESANRTDTDFPIQNLPLGAFISHEGNVPRLGVAIGDQVLDLRAAADAGGLDDLPKRLREACRDRSLNLLMSLGPGPAQGLRQRLSALLGIGAAERDAMAACLRPQAAVEMVLPAEVGDYTDFYASVFHAANVGSLFRPDNPLLPNYKYVPVGYHGRSSSLVPDGSSIRRPAGQRPAGSADGVPPDFGPSRQLDYELEAGFFIGEGNALGQPIGIRAAAGHIFGMCLLNDWSARDLQRWEYQPLGPFLGKNFGTTLSPWVVTMAALTPFRAPAFSRPEGDPVPLAYLADSVDAATGALDVTLEVFLASRAMREQELDPVRLSRGNLRDLYWTPAQLVAHHASNGCNLRPGDLLGSGTVSGADKGSRGCLLELTWRGRDPIVLPTGEKRAFLEDGDEVTFRGRCERDGFCTIGFGACRGTILPAHSLPAL